MLASAQREVDAVEQWLVIAVGEAGPLELEIADQFVARAARVLG